MKGPCHKAIHSFYTGLSARGALCLLCGMWLYYQEFNSINAASSLLAALLAVDGMVMLWVGYGNFLKDSDWWPVLAKGLSSLIFAICILLWPQMEPPVLGVLVACWALWQGLGALFLCANHMAPRWYGWLGTALSLAAFAMIWFWERLEVMQSLPIFLTSLGLATFIGGMQGQRSLAG